MCLMQHVRATESVHQSYLGVSLAVQSAKVAEEKLEEEKAAVAKAAEKEAARTVSAEKAAVNKAAEEEEAAKTAAAKVVEEQAAAQAEVEQAAAMQAEQNRQEQATKTAAAAKKAAAHAAVQEAAFSTSSDSQPEAASVCASDICSEFTPGERKMNHIRLQNKLSELIAQKAAALESENYDRAKDLKAEIDALKKDDAAASVCESDICSEITPADELSAHDRLQNELSLLKVQKAAALESENYDRAKTLKVQIDAIKKGDAVASMCESDICSEIPPEIRYTVSQQEMKFDEQRAAHQHHPPPPHAVGLCQSCVGERVLVLAVVFCLGALIGALVTVVVMRSPWEVDTIQVGLRMHTVSLRLPIICSHTWYSLCFLLSSLSVCLLVSGRLAHAHRICQSAHAYLFTTHTPPLLH